MKQGWEIKKLGECFEYIKNGANIKQERGAGGIPITRIETLSGGVFNRDRLGYADIETIDKYQSYVMESGDLLLSHINSKSYIGRVVVYVKEGDETIIHGMNLLRLKVIPDLISSFYMYYYSQTHKFKSQIANRRKDAVNQSSISVADLKTIDVPVPPREEQERIVEELDCLSGVIEKKREQLKELDALAQSIFYQMFGDPITNEKGWEVKRINEVCSIFGRIGFRGYTTNDLVSNSKDGAISLSPSNIINGHLDYSKCTYISWFKYEESPEIKIYNEDILLVKTGSSYGKCALVRNLPHKATINPQFVVLKNFKINNRYLTCCLQSYPVKFEFDKFTIGAAIPTFSQKNLGNMQIAIPPLTFQQEFADKIEAIEKQKELIKKSISETENLFNARMDYYFN